MNLSIHYLEEIRRQMHGYKRLADGALAQISEEEFFRELDPESNSIAVVVKHMAGNMRSRFTDFLTTDGEKPDRNRDQEFEVGTSDRAAFLKSWEQGWKALFDTIDALKPEDVERTVTIRSEAHSVSTGPEPGVGALGHACWADCLSCEIFPVGEMDHAQRAARKDGRVQREDAGEARGKSLRVCENWCFTDGLILRRFAATEPVTSGAKAQRFWC